MSDNPNSHGQGINPPRTGEFQLAQLMQYPNQQVRALAHHLRHAFGWWSGDSFTGEYISHLYNFVDRTADGRFDFSRIQPGAGEGDGRISYLDTLRYNEGRGPAPHRIEYIETRAAFCRRVGEGRAREDGTHVVGFQRIPVGGGIVCLTTGTSDRRGRVRITSSTCHTW